jgi:hypothetical protein
MRYGAAHNPSMRFTELGQLISDATSFVCLWSASLNGRYFCKKSIIHRDDIQMIILLTKTL